MFVDWLIGLKWISSGEHQGKRVNPTDRTLKLFLDMVSSFSTDVTGAMRGCLRGGVDGEDVETTIKTMGGRPSSKRKFKV